MFGHEMLEAMNVNTLIILYKYISIVINLKVCLDNLHFVSQPNT